jgi:hypothetical protein
VIRHGHFLRYGQILRQLKQDECPSSSFQLMLFDSDGLLGDFLRTQTQAITILAESFISHDNLECRLIDVEIVSCRARALIRIRLTNPNCLNIENLIQKIISVFCMAVEVYGTV